MEALAVVLTEPKRIELRNLPLSAPTESDVVVDVRWSGISTGTERLLWTGRMPSFPGMGYPLVPGYEACGEVVEAPATSPLKAGDFVFVPGASCFGPVRGLFGASASRLVVPSQRAIAIDGSLGERGILLALAATAFHALQIAPKSGPLCIVGHGVLGRLIARLAIATGRDELMVWENNPSRRSGADGYTVSDSASDERRDYASIIDVSGDGALLDTLITRVRRNGEIVLAGFYSAPLSFVFPPAFMREISLRIAAEWQPADLVAVSALVAQGRLSLDGLITHSRPVNEAADAYPVAFDDPECLKMVLSWRAS